MGGWGGLGILCGGTWTPPRLKEHGRHCFPQQRLRSSARPPPPACLAEAMSPSPTDRLLGDLTPSPESHRHLNPPQASLQLHLLTKFLIPGHLKLPGGRGQVRSPDQVTILPWSYRGLGPVRSPLFGQDQKAHLSHPSTSLIMGHRWPQPDPSFP